MTTRRKKLIILGFALAAIAATLFFTRNTEPGYGGHPLSYWVIGYIDANRRSGGTLSDKAISHIGTNAIPYLLKWISEEPSESKAITVINIPIRWLNQKLNPKADWSLLDKSKFLPSTASRAFWALGSQASSAAPELDRILNGSKGLMSRHRAAAALGDLGQPGLVPLTVALTNSCAEVRQAAWDSFSNLGTNALPAIPLLIAALDDKEMDTKQAASRTLCALKIEPDLVVPTMIARLRNEDSTDTTLAVAVLCGYENFARPALPALRNLLDTAAKSNDIDRYRQVIWAIRKIDPQSIIDDPPILLENPR